MSSFEALYEKYDVDDSYNNPESYGESASAYGEGKYPPDWFERKKAVLDFQSRACGRCGRSDANYTLSFEAHHYVPLGEGGGNELENVVVLCVDCHSAIHPGVEETAGDWRRAPRYPIADADPRVRFVVLPDPSTDLLERIFLELLAQTSTPGENVHAQSGVTVGLSPKDAIEAETRLEEMLKNRGFQPEAIRDAVVMEEHTTGDRLEPTDLPADWTCARCGSDTPYHEFVSFRVLTYDTDKRLALCWDCATWAVENSDRREADVLSELRFTVPGQEERFLAQYPAATSH